MTAIDYKFTPRDWQYGCMKQTGRRNVIVAHRRSGKTILVVNRLIISALTSKNRMWRGIYVAPMLKQAKAIAWDYIKEYSRCVPGMKYNESELRADFPNGPRIRLFGGDNPDSMRGIEANAAVLDEVAQMKTEIWEEIIDPILTFSGGWADFIGTPKGMDYFYKLYMKADKLDDWRSFYYPATVTGILTKEQLGKAEREADSQDKFRQEYLCDWGASSKESLISIDLARERMGQGLNITDYYYAPKVLGIDVGRENDPTVIIKRQGLSCEMPIELNIPDNMIVASRIGRIIDEWDPDAVFIDRGEGAGVIDRLRQLKYKVIEVPFNSKASSEVYLNKRSEMYAKAKEWLKSGGVLPSSDRLLSELTAVQVVDNVSDKLQLEKKKLTKERLGRSPDNADAFALTFAHSVKTRKEREMIAHRVNVRRKKYHVHQRFQGAI